MTREPAQFEVEGGRLAADRWAGTGACVMLLHAGVADRRSWYATAEGLTSVANVVAYDRRGFGDSPSASTPYRHIDDLISVLDYVSDEPAWLVGSSMGGQVALDAAVTHAERIAGLVLFAPAVSGAPEPEQIDPETQRLSDLLDAAAENPEERNRLETWLWLDGPAGPEHRVTGSPRDLALAMNAIVLRNGGSDEDGASDIEAWSHLAELSLPVTVAWGDLDVPFLVQQCEELVRRLPNARRRVLSGTAHLPYLESPELVADVVRRAVTGA